MMGILDISGIEKHFGGNNVLNGVEMDVAPGMIHQLIGPNGSGKTTLINVVSGMLAPDAGTISFDGKSITSMGLYATYNAGLVRTWQIPQPFTGLSTLENLMVSGTGNSGESFLLAPFRPRWRRDEEEMLKKAEEVMKITNLYDKRDTPSRDLSGGQQKLLELGRAMMSDARMILMDEPIAGVNPTLAHEIFEKISEICKKQGITFLVIEHRLDIALQYVHSVFAMDKGVIVAHGEPDEVMNHPKVAEAYLGK